jgi:gamma-glutamyltranspeptidase/glutathione hydrolase
VIEARRFPSACVASPHYLASAAGLAVLAGGGNAMDAAIATNLTLGAVTPYLCGYGGDLFAIVWQDGLHAYNGSGRAPAGATPEAVRSAAGQDAMPTWGPHPVTVPGAPEAWFTLLERFGTRTFAELAQWGLRYAREGFVLTEKAGQSLDRSKPLFSWSPQWQAVYGPGGPGTVLRQPELARTIEALVEDGPDAYYRGPIAAAIATHVQSLGGLMTPDDLAAHHGDWVEPLRLEYRGFEILEMPPNTQGVAALEALGIAGSAGPLPAEPLEREHLLLEGMKLAMGDRNRFVTDPEHMTRPATDLLSAHWLAERREAIDPARAGEPQPDVPARGGTAYMCAADPDGMCVSLIQSNYMGFGSGVHVPGWGINLHNRGASFSLDPSHANVIAPRKRTMHTLIPSLVLREGRPWLVFGTMGGDGQAQTHLQVLTKVIDDGEDIQRAIDAPRWVVSTENWSVVVESRFDPNLIEGLRGKGHRISTTEPYNSLMGHAHAIGVTEDGYLGASDPRAEGAVLGL